MKFFHRTTEERWQAIQEEGVLWGIHGNLKNINRHKKNIYDSRFFPRCNNRLYRYTYLSPDDHGESFGSVLLEVEYEPKREDASVCVGGYIENGSEHSIKHNYGFDPPPGQYCTQFSVFEPIPLEKVKKVN